MLANKNNLRSELTANIGVLATTISITAGEGILWENDMVACLEHYENDVCTKREIIKITAKNNDTFTITRGFAVCIMNDETKQQGQGSQTFVAGDFLSLYLSKEIWESITQNIGINETALQTMVGHINAPRTHINDNCLSWKQSIDSAYNTKYGGLAGFGDASDGDLVITEDTFLDASREYNFNNLTICENATLRFCGLGVPTINVRNNFKNYGTIDMRAPYLQARNTQLTDHRLFNNDKVSNKTDDLTQLGTEGGFYKGGSGAGGTASGSDASDGHGGNGGSGGAYDGINGGNGGTSGDFGTGGGGGFGMGKGGNGGTGACSGGNGGNGFYGGQGGNVTRRSRFDGGGGAGGKGVIRGGDAGGGVGGCDYNTLGNGGNAITNVYGLHLNARNIWNNLVTAKGGDGGNGGIYYRSGTSGGYAPSGGNGGNGANGGEIMVSYDTMHEQGTFDVSGGKGGTGAKMGFSSESYWRYEQPNGTDGTAGRVVFKNLNNPYIENFTLTNDEDNESILISWKDPTFKPSSTIQWKNTMIRVSTTNYPATITDGTLVVNETTKNQYESTPFSMSATDGVTYYFTAFAIAQDNTMIDVQTNSITTDFIWGKYQKVEYIQSTGTQWINTGLFAYNYYQTEVKIEVSTTTQNIPIFGTYPNNSASVYYHLTPFSSKFYFGKNNVESNAGTYNATIGQQYVITFNNSNSRLIVNDVDIASTSGTVGAPNTTLTISRRGGTSQSVYYGQFKYFYFKMFNKNTGKYDREMYPCYRKSDNVIGMLDIVNKVFYTNSGSGSFTKGPDIN